MIEKQFLLILAGLPASGKSYFAKYMKKALESTAPDFKVKIVDPDNIRNEFSNRTFNPEIEYIVRANNLKLIKESLKEGDVVISDDLNYYTSMRHDLKEIANEFFIPFFIIHISTPIEICLKWNNQRGNPIPNELIHQINEKFDTFDNYNWEKPLALLDSSTADINDTISSIIIQIEKKLGDFDLKRDKFQKIEVKLGSNENLDIITRKIVGNLLNNEEFQGLKFKLLDLRKKFVKIKKGDLKFDKEISREFINYVEKKLNVKII